VSVGAGEIAGWLVAGGTVLISALTLLGKNKQDSFSRLDSERARLEGANKTLGETVEKLRVQLKECEDMQHRYAVLIEFLGDILSNAYPLDWIKTRAQTLKDREKP